MNLDAGYILGLVRKYWSDVGECKSCGWHGSMFDHSVYEADIEYAMKFNGGKLELSCASDDENSEYHRGVRIDLNELITRAAAALAEGVEEFSDHNNDRQRARMMASTRAAAALGESQNGN